MRYCRARLLRCALSGVVVGIFGLYVVYKILDAALFYYGQEIAPKTETKIDDEGREYRVCPQCGSNMYRQGRTWTCENCGYSYVE